MLDECPNKFKNLKAKEGYDTEHIESIKRLFPDSHYQQLELKKNNYELINKKNVGLAGRPHFQVAQTSANRDNVSGIFNSPINQKYKIYHVTPKINNENFSKFANSAKKTGFDNHRPIKN